MKKLFKRMVAAAMAACVTLGLMTVGAGATRYEYDTDRMGRMVQRIRDNDTGFQGYYLVDLVSVGTAINFSDPGTISIYGEGEYGVYTPKLVEENCTSFTIPDDKNTYVFTAADGGMALFRGAKSQQAPIFFVGDMEIGSACLRASKPIVDITVEPVEFYNYEGGSMQKGNVLVYQVAVGTTLEPWFGSQYMMITDAWNKDGTVVKDVYSLTTKQFPDAEISEGYECANLPVTFKEAGYYYGIRPEALACDLPVIKVVEEQAADYALRQANFSDMNWSKEHVEKVYAYGWMEGVGNGKFNPNGNLTIAEAITLAVRLHAAQTNRPIPASEGAWYQTYVDYYRNNYLLSWIDEDMLTRLNEKATRLDMVRIMSSAVSLPSLRWDEEETVVVPDMDKDNDEYAWLVYDWYRNGIVTGDNIDHSFNPDSNITRGEVAVILRNLLGL